MAYTRNEGRLPDECVVTSEDGVTSYRAVHVRLHGGWDSRKAGAAPWPSAGGRPPTRWSIGKPPHNFDIAEWDLA